MLELIIAAATPAAGGGFDINALLTLVGGAAGAAAAWKIIGLVLDKLIPSRTDKRSDVESTFKVLSDTLEILRRDKELDQKYLDNKQQRIVVLESEADTHYKVLKELRDERDALIERLRIKDQHLNELVHKIQLLGASVSFSGEGFMSIRLPEHLLPVETDAA